MMNIECQNTITSLLATSTCLCLTNLCAWAESTWTAIGLGIGAINNSKKNALFAHVCGVTIHAYHIANQVPYATFDKSGKGRHVHVCMWPYPHVTRGQKTLQMQYYAWLPCTNMGKCESKIQFCHFSMLICSLVLHAHNYCKSYSLKSFPETYKYTRMM